MAEDLYATLGVPRTADAETLKKAFRTLAKDLHPDRNPGDAAAEARFKAVSHAYDVLGDESRRKLYDEFGEAGLREGFDPERARAYQQYARQGGGRAGGRVNLDDLFGAHPGGVDMNDMFGDLFGRGPRGGRRRGAGRVEMRGPDLESEVAIDFLASVRGTTLELRPRGAASEPIKVRIPPGAEDGSRVRIAGQGGPSPTGGGASGDLLLVVRVQPHHALSRKGDDLYLDVPISIREAFHGGKIPVPTIDGSVTLKIPPHTQSGRELRLRGKGVARKGREPGDLYVRLLVHVPTDDAAAATIDKIVQSDPRADLKL